MPTWGKLGRACGMGGRSGDPQRRWEGPQPAHGPEGPEGPEEAADPEACICRGRLPSGSLCRWVRSGLPCGEQAAPSELRRRTMAPASPDKGLCSGVFLGSVKNSVHEKGKRRCGKCRSPKLLCPAHRAALRPSGSTLGPQPREGRTQRWSWPVPGLPRSHRPA